MDIIVKAINPGYEIASKGLSIKAIPSKSSKETVNDSKVVASNTTLKDIDLNGFKVRKYSA